MRAAHNSKLKTQNSKLNFQTAHCAALCEFQHVDALCKPSHAECVRTLCACHECAGSAV